MKPYQLLAALMHKERIRPLPLARAVRKENLQPQIQRFVRGNVPSPAHSTAAPLAEYFDIPLEAMYDERAATAVAKERGLTVVDWPPVAARRAEAPAKENAPHLEAALREFERLTPEQRAEFLRLAGAPPQNPAPPPAVHQIHPPAHGTARSISSPMSKRTTPKTKKDSK